MNALGMIEVRGYLPAVEALDAALKAAQVRLCDVTIVQGGLVAVLVTGDVGAVKAAIDAASAAAERVGHVISVHVIPKPASSVEQMLGKGRAETPPDPDPRPSRIKAQPPESTRTASGLPEPTPTAADPYPHVDDEDFEYLNLGELREVARCHGLNDVGGKDLRYVRKEKLIAAIREQIRKGG